MRRVDQEELRSQFGISKSAREGQQLNEHILSKITEKRIFTIRGQRVMLDSDLADLYQVKTKELNLAVKRNLERFPSEFMFQLTQSEQESLRF